MVDEESIPTQMVGRNIKINTDDIRRIKLALSSLSNTVILCPMVADLYVKTLTTENNRWVYFKSGVPVIIVNHDAHKNVIALQICVADHDSGFAIWRESLSNTSGYKALRNDFHIFRMSSCVNTLAGLKFFQSQRANIFLRDVLYYIPKGSTFLNNHTTLAKKVSKEEISGPCMFLHVTTATATTGRSSKSLKLKSKSLEALYGEEWIKRSSQYSVEDSVELLPDWCIIDDIDYATLNATLP